MSEDRNGSVIELPFKVSVLESDTEFLFIGHWLAQTGETEPQL